MRNVGGGKPPGAALGGHERQSRRNAHVGLEVSDNLRIWTGLLDFGDDAVAKF